MQVAVEKLEGLQRRLTVSIPADVVQDKVAKRMLEVSKTVDIKGFRKGKAPLAVVKLRFGEAVFKEVVSDQVRESFGEALDQEKLEPAGLPEIDITDSKNGEPVSYTATFEVYPEFEMAKLDKVQIEKYKVEISDDDVQKMLEKMRKQHVEWKSVERKSKTGDQLDVDFVGKMDGVEFEGGEAKGFKVELGSGNMIPGFEDKLVKRSAGDRFDFDLHFPDDYLHSELSGKLVNFSVKVNTVCEPELPELNDAFAKKAGVEEGGLDKLKEQVKNNLERERDQMIKTQFKEKFLDKLIELNQFEMPNALIDTEIKQMQDQFKARMEQAQEMGRDLDFSADKLEEQANRRVRLGLIFSKLIKEKELKVNQDKVKKMIEAQASMYQFPEQIVNYYYNNPEHLKQIESLVLEDQAIDLLSEDIKIKDVPVSFEVLSKPKTTETDS